MKRVFGVGGAQQRDPMNPEDPLLNRSSHDRNSGDDDGLGDFPGIENGQDFFAHVAPHGGVYLFIKTFGFDLSTSPVDSEVGFVPRDVAAVCVQGQGSAFDGRVFPAQGSKGGEPLFMELQAGVQSPGQVVGNNRKLRA